jgi:SAM-dependent methyltransferase
MEDGMNCRICGGAVRETIQTRDMMADNKNKYFYEVCSDCGAWQIDKIPEDMGQFYKSDYYSYTENPDNMKKTNDTFIAKSMITKFNLTEKSSILDYGAGNLQLLKAFYENGCGVDGELYRLRGYDKYAPEVNWKGIKIQNTLPTDIKFDFILSKHTIEHETDPREHIKNLLSLLTSGGGIRLAMPNADSYCARLFKGNWTGIDGPRHLHILTPKALKLIVNECGGDVVDEEYQCIWLEYVFSKAFKEGRNWRTKDAYFMGVKQDDRVRFSHFCNTLAELKDGDGFNCTIIKKAVK